jgi:hypothetical protein
MDELGKPTNASLAAFKIPFLATEGWLPVPPVLDPPVVMEPAPESEDEMGDWGVAGVTVI